MSRHQLDPLPDAADPDRPLDVCIGWDAPLCTFFLVVLRPQSQSDAGEIVFESGQAWREEPDVDPLLAVAARYAVVPAELRDRLEAERLADTRPVKPKALVDLEQLLGSAREPG